MTTKMNNRDRDIVVAALKHAAPYIRMFKGKTFIVKAGGEVFQDSAGTQALMSQIAVLHQVGIRVVVVHGAGPQTNRRSREQGLEPTLVEGRRITDAATIEVMTAVNSEIGQQIILACDTLDLPAVAMGAANPGPIIAVQRPPKEVPGHGRVDYGFVGDVEGIDKQVIEAELQAGRVPVVSALSAATDGTVLNINADTVAAALAAGLGAEKMILATGAPGILEDVNDPSSLISYLDLEGLKQLFDSGALADGMLPKSDAIETAINGGVPRVHIISFRQPDSLLLEVFTNEGTGTLVVKSIAALSDAEQATGT